MAGYKRKGQIFKLKFVDPEMEGLEVRCRGVNLSTFFDVQKAARLTELQGRRMNEEDMAAARNLFLAFSKALVSWNLTDEDDQPVPATLDGIESQELDFALQIVIAWINAVSGVPVDLGKGSPSGGTSPGGSPMTEASLASLSSSLTPEQS